MILWINIIIQEGNNGIARKPIQKNVRVCYQTRSIVLGAFSVFLSVFSFYLCYRFHKIDKRWKNRSKIACLLIFITFSSKRIVWASECISGFRPRLRPTRNRISIRLFIHSIHNSWVHVFPSFSSRHFGSKQEPQDEARLCRSHYFVCGVRQNAVQIEVQFVLVHW